MLIYNHKKEFVGIDEKDLNLLGFSNLSELINEASDFADMFVKTPGFIHNFQHVNWIDFVECADSSENAKVIIHAKERNFQCQLSVNTAYLNDNSSTKAYLVYLSNVKELTDNETEYISIDLLKQTTPKPLAEPKEIPKAVEFIVEEEKKAEQIQTLEKVKVEEKVATPKPSLDMPISLDFDDEEVSQQEEKLPETHEEIVETAEIYDNGYIYDPLVASSALGLPVDLIEEFIEDFIAQAKEFKDTLYDAFNNGDSENIKIHSHKLKGVAANLRIEDALESLTIINTSDNNNEIKNHIDTFYKIVAKLSNEKIIIKEKKEVLTSPMTAKIPQNETIKNDTPIEIDLDMNDDIFITPTDEDVPTKIEMPELADDDFVAPTDELDNEIFDFKEVNESTEVSEFEEFSLESTEDLDLEDELDLEENKPLYTPYNKNVIAQEIGLDEESFNELFQDYISEAKEISILINNAVDSNESAIWNKQALKLKMMNENMRITDFSTELDTLMQTQDKTIAKEISTKISALILEIEA